MYRNILFISPTIIGRSFSIVFYNFFSYFDNNFLIFFQSTENSTQLQYGPKFLKKIKYLP